MSTGVFLSIRENARSPYFNWLPTKPTSSYSIPCSVSNHSNFSWGHLRPQSFFSKHVFTLKTKFFPCLKVLRCISASSCSPSKEFLSLLYKAFLWLFLIYASPGWFPFFGVTNITKLNAFTEQLVASSPATSRPPLSLFFSLRRLYLPYESL